LQDTTAKIVGTRTHLLQTLSDMGLHVPPSRANFVFPRIPSGRALEVYETLEKRRILVRYFRGPLVADSLRVTVGTDAEVEAFVRALRELRPR
jgi:histidinol-phosphate aminotransferase